jgi:hypothetical protein
MHLSAVNLVLSAALCALIIAAIARVAYGGPLDPSGAPAPTKDLPPAWSRALSTTGADPCNTPRFTCVLSGSAVLDQETGIVWQRAPNTAAALSFTDAAVRCATAEVGNRYGWRLPRFQELTTLFDDSGVNPNPSLPANHPFTLTTQVGYFWTFTGFGSDIAVVRFVGASPGNPGDFSALPDTTPGVFTWCVRSPAADDD